MKGDYVSPNKKLEEINKAVAVIVGYNIVVRQDFQ